LKNGLQIRHRQEPLGTGKKFQGLVKRSERNYFRTSSVCRSYLVVRTYMCHALHVANGDRNTKDTPPATDRYIYLPSTRKIYRYPNCIPFPITYDLRLPSLLPYPSPATVPWVSKPWGLPQYRSYSLSFLLFHGAFVLGRRVLT
jgi:hypothetical protein